jgi:hypothetical protein
MEPVSFVTIFLPLLVGVQPVELAVTQDVASVNVILDGAQVAELREAPWTFEVDFGTTSRPIGWRRRPWMHQVWPSGEPLDGSISPMPRRRSRSALSMSSREAPPSGS